MLARISFNAKRTPLDSYNGDGVNHPRKIHLLIDGDALVQVLGLHVAGKGLAVD